MNRYIIKKEVRESLYVAKGMWMLVVASLLLTALCVVAVSLKETMSMPQSTLLEYATKATMFITLAISMVLGSSSFISEREENTLESLLLTPIPKLNLSVAKLTGVVIIGFLFYIIAIPYLIAIGVGTGLTVSSILFILIIGGLLLLAFSALSEVLSIIMSSSKTAILTSILILFVLSVPSFVPGLLKNSAIGRLFLSINPVNCSFDMMRGMLVNHDPFSSLIKYIIPIVIFTALCLALLAFTSEKVALKGEK